MLYRIYRIRVGIEHVLQYNNIDCRKANLYQYYAAPLYTAVVVYLLVCPVLGIQDITRRKHNMKTPFISYALLFIIECFRFGMICTLELVSLAVGGVGGAGVF